MTTKCSILTVGHSNHEVQFLINLLKQHGVTAVADIRSTPYSAAAPQFNRENLMPRLQSEGFKYVYLGDELGAHPQDPACYKQGKVQYSLQAKTSLFRQGLQRVISGAQKYRLALLCVEKDPLECHRSVLHAGELEAQSVDVVHILADGSIESHTDTMDRLLKGSKLDGGDLFRTREELVEEACRRQEHRIAYVNETMKDETST
ncbi:MAG TPA: DUF488 domain-containing protein [Pyrinomonadaceae bacterium]